MVTMFIIISFLSFAGVPPLAGFLSKFLIFIHIFFKSNFIIFIFFLFINLFVIYFYIQNLRFMIAKQISNIFIYKNYTAYLNKTSLFSTNFLNYFNLTLIFYFEELFLYFNLISSTILL
jgi:NADH:ubiquinone oxidoreductase subunit 2 (subunit N)